MEDTLKQLQTMCDIPNVYDFNNGDVRYTTEFNVIFYYKNGSYDVSEQTYSELEDSITCAKEWVEQDKDINYAEITLQTTKWTLPNGNWIDPETVGDVVVAYYRSKDI